MNFHQRTNNHPGEVEKHRVQNQSCACDTQRRVLHAQPRSDTICFWTEGMKIRKLEEAGAGTKKVNKVHTQNNHRAQQGERFNFK